MATTLYHCDGCPCGLKVLLAAKFAGIDVKIVDSKDGSGKHPLGKVPVLETPDGILFESNAAARWIARGTRLLGATPFEGALIDQWIEFCTELDLPACAWICPIMTGAAANQAAVRKAKSDVRKVMGVLNAHLLTRTFFVGERPTMADLAIFASLLGMYKLVLDPGFRKEFKNLNRWFVTVAHNPVVASVVGEVELCVKPREPKFEEAAAAAGEEKKGGKGEKKPKGEKPKPKPKEEKPKKEEAQEAAGGDDEDEEAEKKEKKPPNPLDLLPPSKTMSMDAWKRVYSNEDTKTVAVPWFWENFDPEGFSVWFCRYKFDIEATQVFMVANGLTGFIQRLDPLRKYGFGSLIIFGEQKPFEIAGMFIFRGVDIPKEMRDCDDFELYEWTKADLVTQKEMVNEFLTWEGSFMGKKFNQAKIFK